MKAVNVYVGAKIQEHREKINMTQVYFAERMNLSRASIANIESGRQAVSIHNLLNISLLLGAKISDLLPYKEWFVLNRDKNVKKVISFEIEEP